MATKRAKKLSTTISRRNALEKQQKISLIEKATETKNIIHMILKELRSNGIFRNDFTISGILGKCE